MPPTIVEILECRTLPSLPAVAMEVLELTKDKEVKLEHLAKVVQTDPALAAKILKTVNSSYYGLTKPCPTISRALAYLGLSTVKSLVLGFSLVETTPKQDSGFDLKDYWRRSLYCAAGARRIAARTNGCDPEEAFIASLMQDVGMLAINAADSEYYSSIVGTTQGDHRRLCPQEKKAYGFDHTEVGGDLGDRWGLPAQLVAAIRSHHRAEHPEFGDLVRIVALSLEMATVVSLPNPGAVLSQLQQHASDWCSFSPTDVKELLGLVAEDVAALASLFNVQTGTPPDIDHILGEAREASTQHQLEVLREADSLRKTNDELSRQVTTDALTRVGNRRLFDDSLEDRFEQAQTMKGNLGLLLIDADRFKSVNDQYGHQVGDAVLIEIASRLSESVRGIDLVCRYGGEEFAVILPGASCHDVASVAQRVRLCICEKPIEVDPALGIESLPVTISVGASVFDASTSKVLTTPALLVAAADKAVYAAKAAGRDCVRVFRAESSAAA